MQYRALGKTGLTVSQIGFGAATLGDEYGKIDPSQGTRAVHAAIDLGINIFDTAPYYGRTLAETRLGEALEGKRDRVLVSTKCARYDLEGFDFSGPAACKSLEGSLRRLRTDHVDIYIVHDVEFGDQRQIIEETLPALEQMKRQGKIRFIGISGLALRMLHEIAQAVPVDCILSYCRYTLLNRELGDTLLPFAQDQGIGLFNASPLHLRILAEQGPPPWNPAPESVRAAGARMVELCRSRGVNVSELAVQFAASHPAIACTYVGPSSPEEVESNVRAVERPLDLELMREIDVLYEPVKYDMWISGKAENH